MWTRVSMVGLVMLLAQLVCVFGVNLEAKMARVPLQPRKHPITGAHYVAPSPSTSPSQQYNPPAIDTKLSSVGNEVSHRTFMDFAESLQFVFPELKFPGTGSIFKWSVYTGRDCTLQLQVFRPAPTPAALDENKEPVKVYTLVGNNTFHVPTLGRHEFVVDRNRISVRKNDVIGFLTNDPGCVSWSDGGPSAMHRVGFPGHREQKALGGVVFVGNGLPRTYSIVASGDFSHAPQLKPAPAQSTSASASPSLSPSVSPSESAIPESASTSISPSMSISDSPTPSTTPSATPSASLHQQHIIRSSSMNTELRTSRCVLGHRYWCANATSMQECGVTQKICDIIHNSLNPPTVSPAPIPSSSHMSSASFLATTSPSISQGLVQQSPSPSPSSAVLKPPYAVTPDADTGLSTCHYCNGGSDWTGGQCLTGQKQSPISLKFDSMDIDPALNLYFSVKYNISRAVVGWNDYAFTITGRDLGSINIDGKNYDAEVAMLHAPSEHKIEGVRTPLELQIYHRLRGSNPPKTLAIAILFEETAQPVPHLDWVFSLPKNHEPKPIVVDLENFVSDLKPLAFYEGSMTMPPCQEDILWGVTMGGAAKVSYLQMKALDSHLKNNRLFAGGRGNNRMTQPMNGRKLTLRASCGISGAIACGTGIPTADQQSQAKGGSAERKEAAAAAKAAEVVYGTPDSDDGMFDDGAIKLW